MNIKNHHNNKIKFLQEIPFFAKWSRTALAKFTYYMKKISFTRKQCLYKEGEPCTHVYLVINGELEVRKCVNKISKKPANQNQIATKVKQGVDFNMMEFLPHAKNKIYATNIKN